MSKAISPESLEADLPTTYDEETTPQENHQQASSSTVEAAPDDSLSAEQLYAERVAYLYAHLPYAFIGSPLLVGLFIALNEPSWANPMSFLWGGYLLVVSFLRFLLWRAYRRAACFPEAAPAWARYFLLGVFAAAAGWGALGFFFSSGPLFQQIMVLLCLTIVGACAVPLLAALRRMLWACIPVLILPLLVPFLLPLPGTENIETTIVGKGIALSVGLSALLIAFGYGFFRTLGKSLQHKILAENHAKALLQSQKQVDILQNELSESTTKKTKIEHELNVAKVAGESANIAKGEFLATMSHEIRTPLNGVIPLLDILRETPLNVEQQDYVETAYASSQHLLRIIDDILDYSKIEAGKLELENVELNLHDLVQSVVDMMAANARNKGVSLEFSLPPEVPIAIRGDPVRLRQVLANLISNAIKFTQKGQVTIHVKPRHATRTTVELLYTVRDSGTGMSQAAINKLFKPFTQADASTTRKHGGTGLGLVICKRLIDLMGGEIGVKSKPGKGSLFWFVVPQRKSTRDIPAARKNLEGVRVLFLRGSNLPLEQQVENYLTNWQMVRDFADSPVEAISKLKTSAALGESWGYDVVLLDAGLTPLVALQLIKEIRNLPKLASVELLVLTEPQEIEADLKNFKNTTLLLKPVEEQVLKRKLNDMLDVAAEEEGPASDLLRFSQEPIDPPAATKPPPVVSPAATSPPAEAPTSNTHELTAKILLVEDNPVNQRVAKKLLARIGMEVFVANNGEEALGVLAKESCEVVLMDCQMPVMDGYQATKAIRAKETEATGHIPIVAMTANAMAGDREKCLATGMDDYLTKPLKRPLLEKTLKAWILEARKRQAAIAPPEKEKQTTSADTLQGTVLLVEDNPVNQRVAKKLLSKLGVEPLTADNGKEALDVLQKHPCDMVLMDCQMPVMDGYQATRAIRQIEQKEGRSRLPIIAVTANKMAGDREKCLDSGMDDYLTKPLKRDNLAKTLLKWLPTPDEASQACSSNDERGEVEMSVLDASVMEELYDVMEEEFVDLLQDFLADAPSLLTQMRDAIRDQQVEALLRPAHSLKSSAANVGALGLSELAKALEAKAREETLAGTPDLFRKTVEEYKKAGLALKVICERGKP